MRGGFVASWTARGSAVTIENSMGVLERFGSVGGAGVGGWARRRRPCCWPAAASTRGGMCRRSRTSVLGGPQGGDRVGVVLEDPVDEFNEPAMSAGCRRGRRQSRNGWTSSLRSCGNGSRPPASTRPRVGTTRCSGPCITGCVLLRQLAPRILIGGRSRSTCGSARALRRPETAVGADADQLDLVLRWYLDDVRPRMADSKALFCDEGGGVLHRGTIRNRLRRLLELEDRPDTERFTPHGLRHACATHNYERGVDLVAIQQMLGHWHVGTTMRYVTPSATFIEDAYRRAHR